MALWIRDGFELYATSADMILGTGYGIWTSQANSSLSTTTRFGTGQSWKPTLSSSFTKNSAFPNAATVFAGCALLQLSGSAGNKVITLQFNDASTTQVTVCFVDSGVIQFFRGTSSGTLIATYSGAFLNSQWNQYQFKIVISSTVGEVHVRKNGSTSDDFVATGLNTQSTANAQANGFSVVHVLNTGIQEQILDDLAVWDTVNDGTAWNDWVGDFRIVEMPPISNNSVQFSLTNGGSTAFGSSLTTSSRSRAANTIFLLPVTPACGGTLGSLSVTLAANLSGHMKCALYDSDGDNTSWDSTPVTFNQPGTLLYQTVELTNPVIGANTFAWTATPLLQKGRKYYVAVWMDAAATINDNNVSTAGQWSFATAYTASWPSLTNKGATLSTQICCVNATITPTNSGMVNDWAEDGATTFVNDSVVGHSDLYNLRALTFTPASILGVDVVGVVEKSDAGTRGVKLQISSAGTLKQYTEIFPNTAFNYFKYQQDTDPATGLPWTSAALNALLLGAAITT